MITNVDWQSPAWQAGLRRRETVLTVNGNKASTDNIVKMVADAHEGDKVRLTILNAGQQKEVEVTLGKKRERSYVMTPMPNPSALQQSIFKSWQGE
jgi:predicted metalloprotease with PDZ domain